MPRRDGSGPSGKGPRTGRGLGSCQGATAEGRRQGGGGMGRGRGRGFGGGAAAGRATRAGWTEAAPAGATDETASPAGETNTDDSLEEQVAGIRSELATVRDQLERLLERFHA